MKAEEFGEHAAQSAGQAIAHFGKSMGVQHPEEITTEKLAAYYRRHGLAAQADFAAARAAELGGKPVRR